MTDEALGIARGDRAPRRARPRADRAHRRRPGRRLGAAPRGYLRAMADAGLSRFAKVIAGRFHRGGRRGGGRDGCCAPATLPTAVFAANDLVAVGLIDRLEQGGVEIPGDVSVVGYDNTFVAALNHIRLTTVNQPRHEMGREALALLLERIERARLPARCASTSRVLVVRSTTRAAAMSLRAAVGARRRRRLRGLRRR